MVCRGAGGNGGVIQPMMGTVGSKYVVSVHAIKNSRRNGGSSRVLC